MSNFSSFVFMAFPKIFSFGLIRIRKYVEITFNLTFEAKYDMNSNESDC